jgi:TolA-binding protein
LAQAYFWLGSSHYALQDCVSAMPAFQTVVSRFTNSQRAPDAMLSLAECQRDLKDKAAARQTINNLIKRFPTSPAAKTGKELLSELK